MSAINEQLWGISMSAITEPWQLHHGWLAGIVGHWVKHVPQGLPDLKPWLA